MTTWLRARVVRLLAAAVLLVTAIAAVASALAWWRIAGVALAIAMGAVGGLVVAVARRERRRSAAAYADMTATAARIERHVATTSDGVERLVAEHDASERRIAEMAANTASLTEDVHAAASHQELRLRLLHSSLLTDAQALHQLMSAYSPVEPLPITAGWAMSPSGLLWLTRHIETARPDLVLECGSGTSTLWCAMALRKLGRGRLVALEHKPEFAAKTRAVLERHGLAEWATVVDAPLVPTDTPRGVYDWYDISALDAGGIGVLLVDGPPKATGPHARYPALPLLAPYLADRAVVVADDMDRADEREAVDYWLEEIAGLASRGNVVEHIAALDYVRR